LAKCKFQINAFWNNAISRQRKKAKALSALHISEIVAEINFQACFVIKKAEKVAHFQEMLGHKRPETI